MKSLLNVGWLLLPILLVNCNTKQKQSASIDDGVRVDTILPKVEMQQEKRVYHSSSKHDFDFRNLSRQFNIKLSVQRFIEKDDLHDSCIVKALFTGEQSGTILDSISLTSLLFYSNYFTDPKNCVSYSTSVHVFKQLVDNYAGDMVVADLDFDGRDDVAIVNDMGGNSVPHIVFLFSSRTRSLF